MDQFKIKITPEIGLKVIKRAKLFGWNWPSKPSNTSEWLAKSSVSKSKEKHIAKTYSYLFFSKNGKIKYSNNPEIFNKSSFKELNYTQFKKQYSLLKLVSNWLNSKLVRFRVSN